MSHAVTLEKVILENLNTAVLLFDANLHLIYINPAGEMLFGLSAQHLVGLPAIKLIHCPDDSVERRLREAMDTLHPFIEREVHMKLGDRAITVHCTALPFHHPASEVKLLVELHQVDRQLRILREEHLLAQHQATQALIRGLAHEIRNPLGGLRGAAQLLQQELPEPSLREYTQIIIDEADRLQKLMDRMLGPNRMLRRQSINIHHVLEYVLDLIQAEYPEGPEITRDYDPSIPEFMADSDRLIQALLNLIRNAISATGTRGRICLRTRVLRQFTIGNRKHRLVLCVEIEDDGPGIPKALQEQIFFPMISNRPGGTGLGLPIAQEMIHQHGGLIECESQPGCTRFFVYLPLDSGHE